MNRKKIPAEILLRAAALYAVLAAVAVLPIIPGLSGCGKEKAEKSPDRISSSDDTGADDDSRLSVDHDLCRTAFDYITSQCGAQFYNHAGELMTQNDLLDACGQPMANCVVECYSAGKECGNIRSCMKNTCGL